ncbi:MAG: hypothetical protein RIS26_45 [Actinomycetota bacterium]|jgi:CobQ-like glutamine amidotransferase family enzyme
MRKLLAVHLYPLTLKLNGEVGNIRALEFRLSKLGYQLEVVASELGESLSSTRPDFIFMGSGTLTATKLAADDLRSKADLILGWIESGTKVLAVGAGFDLVSRGLKLADGQVLFGLSLTDTTHQISANHLVGEVVATGDIAGFVNSNRHVHRDSETFALAKVTASDEDALVGYTDGYKDGVVLASNIQGPLLPMNPRLADEFLAWIIGDFEPETNLEVDQLAAQARNSISSRVNR